MAEQKTQTQVSYNAEFFAYMDTLPERVSVALEIIGGSVESYAKEACPVDTGRLRNSITHWMGSVNDQGQSAPNESAQSVVIGSDVEYAPYVELGHHQTPGRFVPAIGKRLKASWVAGKPYLRPALENHMEEYRYILERVLDPDYNLRE